jgi:hypothetical protein
LMIFSALRQRFRHYTHGVLVALDRLTNAFLGGQDNETISSRVGRAALAGKRWGLIMQRIINWLMNNPNHCRSEIGV